MEVREEFKDYLQLSDSRRGCFESCAKKYFWRYEFEDNGIVPLYGNTAIRYGRVWHFALQSLYDFVKSYGWKGPNANEENLIAFTGRMAKESWEEESKNREFNEDYRTLENLINSLLHYIDYWHEERAYIEVIETEQQFQVPMVMTEDELKMFPDLLGVPILITGIIDLICRMHSSKWIMEHKSTGSWIQQVLETLQRSAQTQQYHWAGGEIDKEDHIEGVMVNLHHISSRKKKDGEYGVTKIEFAREPHIYTKGDIQSWRESVLYTIDKLHRARRTNVWPMNLDSCHLYNRKCEFTDLCEQNRRPEETNVSGFAMRQDI